MFAIQEKSREPKEQAVAITFLVKMVAGNGVKKPEIRVKKPKIRVNRRELGKQGQDTTDGLQENQLKII